MVALASQPVEEPMSEQRDPKRTGSWSAMSIVAAVLAVILVAYVLVGTLTEERGDIVRPNTRSEAPGVPTSPGPQR